MEGMIRPIKLRRNYDVGTIWLGNRSHHFLSSKTQPHRLLVPRISDCQIDAHFRDNFITFIRPNQIYHHLWIILFNKNYEYIMKLLFRQPSQLEITSYYGPKPVCMFGKRVVAAFCVNYNCLYVAKAHLLCLLQEVANHWYLINMLLLYL